LVFQKKYAELETVKFSPNVVTIWYRSPELLFGADIYGPAVDIWSAGCVFAEMMLRAPFFGGENELDQLSRIFYVCGTPNVEEWPGLDLLPDYVPFAKSEGIPFKEIFQRVSDEVIDLLKKMLKYDPRERPSAEKSLAHPYYTSGENPTRSENLDLPESNLEELRLSVEQENHIISHSNVL